MLFDLLHFIFFVQFYKAVLTVDKYIDFSKLKVPDLQGYDKHNMGIYNMDEDVADAAKELEHDDTPDGSKAMGLNPAQQAAQIAAEVALDVRKPNKRAGKSTNKIAAPAVGALQPAPASAKKEEAKEVPAVEVEVMPELAPTPKRRASKKKAPVVVDAGVPKEDLEIKEMVSNRS